jgi:hypothetical protein
VSVFVSSADIIQNPLLVCLISAFTASYTSLYVRNKDKADDIIADTVKNQNDITRSWSQADLNGVISLNKQAEVPEVQAEPVEPVTAAAQPSTKGAK